MRKGNVMNRIREALEALVTAAFDYVARVSADR
jgi:hypothetical protein